MTHQIPLAAVMADNRLTAREWTTTPRFLQVSPGLTLLSGKHS